MFVSLVNKDENLAIICGNFTMLNLQKIRKMVYNPSGKNQENQKNWPLLEDGQPADVGDEKYLKRGTCIYRGWFLKVGMDKKLTALFSISLSHSKCFLFDTFNISINIYLPMTIFLRCIRTFSDGCNIWKLTVKKGYGFFRNLVLIHLNHFIQLFFIPVFANSLIKLLTSMRGFCWCWAFKKWGTGGGGSGGSSFSCSLKALQRQISGKCIDFLVFQKKNCKI